MGYSLLTAKAVVVAALVGTQKGSTQEGQINERKHRRAQPGVDSGYNSYETKQRTRLVWIVGALSLLG